MEMVMAKPAVKGNGHVNVNVIRFALSVVSLAVSPRETD